MASFAGVLAQRYPYQGLIAFIGVLFLGSLRRKSWVDGLFLGLCVSLAFFYAGYRSEQIPEEPLWLQQAMGGDKRDERAKAVYIKALIENVEMQSQGRMRLSLSKLRPVERESLKSGSPLFLKTSEKTSEKTSGKTSGKNTGKSLGQSEPFDQPYEHYEPYGGIILASIKNLESVPLPGQSIEGSFRFARQRAFANPGSFDIERYWKDKGFFIRAWNSSAKTDPPLIISGKAKSSPNIWRSELWQGFLSVLPNSVEGSGWLKSFPSHIDSLSDSSSASSSDSLSDSSSASSSASSRDSLSDSSSNPHFIYPRLSGTASAFLPALIFGDRSFVSLEQRNLMSSSTLAHSIALSGLHLGYAAAFGAMLAWGICLIFPAIQLYIPRPKLMMIMALPMAGAYLWLGGAPVSLVRSAAMLAFFSLLLFLKKPKVLLDGLLIAVAFILLKNPAALFDISLQMSALSVAVIALFIPSLQKLAKLIVPDLAPYSDLAKAISSQKPGSLKKASEEFIGKALEDFSQGEFSLNKEIATAETDLKKNDVSSFIFSEEDQEKIKKTAALISYASAKDNDECSSRSDLLTETVLQEEAEKSSRSASAFKAANESNLGFWAVFSWRYRLRAAILVLMLSFSIQVFLSPIILNSFGTVGLAFPLNLIWLPVLGLIVMPMAFITLFLVATGFLGLASICAKIAVWPCQLLMDLLSFLKHKGLLSAPALMCPHWLAYLGFWLFLLALPLVIMAFIQFRKSMRLPFERKKLYLPLFFAFSGLLLFLSVITKHYYDFEKQPVSLAVIDVGQGQALCVNWPGGRALVDGGGFVNSDFDIGQGVIAPYLNNKKPSSLDWLLNTHPDFDHLGGLIWLLNNFKLREGYAHNGEEARGELAVSLPKALAQQKNIKVQSWKRGDLIKLHDDLFFEVLWPDPKFPKFKGNDASVVVRLIWKGEGLAVLCGDAGIRVLRQIIKSDGEKLKARILLLPHHGAASAFLPEFYNAVQPEIAIASCAFKNQWNLPSEKIRQVLAEKSIPLLSTAEHGQIMISWDDFGRQKIEHVRGERIKSQNERKVPPGA